MELPELSAIVSPGVFNTSINLTGFPNRIHDTLCVQYTKCQLGLDEKRQKYSIILNPDQ